MQPQGNTQWTKSKPTKPQICAQGWLYHWQGKVSIKASIPRTQIRSLQGRQCMEETEFGRMWVLCTPRDYTEQPCTGVGVISWVEIWEDRFRNIMEGRTRQQQRVVCNQTKIQSPPPCDRPDTDSTCAQFCDGRENPLHCHHPYPVILGLIPDLETSQSYSTLGQHKQEREAAPAGPCAFRWCHIDWLSRRGALRRCSIWLVGRWTGSCWRLYKERG